MLQIEDVVKQGQVLVQVPGERQEIAAAQSRGDGGNPMNGVRRNFCATRLRVSLHCSIHACYGRCCNTLSRPCLHARKAGFEVQTLATTLVNDASETPWAAVSDLVLMEAVMTTMMAVVDRGLF